MGTLTILLIAVGLALDTLAVAIAVSLVLGGASPRQVFRLAFHCGLLQALMPILGWLAGRSLGPVLAGWHDWAAFALLVFIGSKAIYEATSGAARTADRPDPTRGLSLVILSFATSIDALAVGVSLAMLDVTIWYPSVVIGCVTCALTAAGMLLGKHLGPRFGTRVEMLGGLILIGIGVKIVLQDLL